MKKEKDVRDEKRSVVISDKMQVHKEGREGIEGREHKK